MSFVVLRIKVEKQKTLAFIEDLYVPTSGSHIFPQWTICLENIYNLNLKTANFVP